MRCKLTILLCFAAILPVLGQTEMKTDFTVGLPVFKYELVNVQSNQENKSRLNIFLQIGYDDLQFVKTDSGYLGAYEISVTINREKGGQEDGKIWSEHVLVPRYEDTNSRDLLSFTNNFFHLPPNKYEIIISVMDKDTKKAHTVKTKVELKNFNEDLAVSDVIIISRFSTDSIGILSIRPLISNDVQDNVHQLYAYFEIYSRKDVEKFKVKYDLKPFKGKRIIQDAFEVEKTGNRTLHAFPLTQAQLFSGKYRLQLEVSDGTGSAKTEKEFIVRWKGLPKTAFDLDTAIDQLLYIADQSDIKKMRAAVGKKKSDLFETFWTKRDPTPGTAANEHMDEYYRRINYANDTFSGFREGWKSDQGMVYIVLGQPSDIERHPFESDSKPYQIWYYFSINRQYIFVDETGFGDYRLIPAHWDDFFREMNRNRGN